MPDNFKEQKSNTPRNDSDYEALLKSEGQIINNAKFDFQPPSENFQKSLKMKIAARRHAKSENNMKKIFEILTYPLKSQYSASLIVLATLLFLVSIPVFPSQNNENIISSVYHKIISLSAVPTSTHPKIDDWQYTYSYSQEDNGGVIRLANPLSGSGAMSKSLSSPSFSENIGFSTGGSKDVNNFRENIKNNYLPLPTDITYEGLFYDYYFDTGKTEQCDKLFCPSYSYAISEDPFSENPEYYLSVGLNSGIKESDFQRKKLNLVIVLDISGSMGSPFGSYYYDQFGNIVEAKQGDSGKTKMEIADESVVALLSHLKTDDRFGMVLFSTEAFLAKPLSLVGDTDMDKLKEHILKIEATDSTNMEAGMKKATKLFDELSGADQNEYENRIIFLTDAMPNTGDYSKEGLMGQVKDNSENKLYSTLIGIGVDFNTELAEAITKIRGANYYSVHSSKEFKQRLDDEFEYMVTPLVFNLRLDLEAQGYEIQKVYGSPEANEATGELMKVNTLFPSKTEDGQTRGGLVLLKLKKVSDNASLKLKTSYEDRSGKSDGSTAEIKISGSAEYFDNNGIRKAVLLTRYANLMKNWIIDERADHLYPRPLYRCMGRETGISDYDRCPIELGQWERQSLSLEVSKEYQDLFEDFKSYFNKEKNAIGDDTLNKESEILNKLINY
jgi:Ca-activated chloride channel homolog